MSIQLMEFPQGDDEEKKHAVETKEAGTGTAAEGSAGTPTEGSTGAASEEAGTGTPTEEAGTGQAPEGASGTVAEVQEAPAAAQAKAPRKARTRKATKGRVKAQALCIKCFTIVEYNPNAKRKVFCKKCRKLGSRKLRSWKAA